jgi:uncharacterized phage protein (TIGR02218 family)
MVDSYRNRERSVYGLRPVECYQFVSTSATWRYTSADQDITLGGNVYTAIALKRVGDIETAQAIERSGIQLEFPKDNVLALQIFLNQSDEIITVTVFRFHADVPTDYSTYWKGRVTGADKKRSPGGSIIVSCESIFSSLQRIGIRERYTKICGVSIYSTKCGVDKALFATAGTVGSISDEILLTIAAASGEDDGYFTAGLAKFGTGTYRWILYHVGSTIKISRPVYGLAVTDSVTLYPGCDLLLDTCINKFNNLPNFRGWPWIPDRCPMDGSSIV